MKGFQGEQDNTKLVGVDGELLNCIEPEIKSF